MHTLARVVLIAGLLFALPVQASSVVPPDAEVILTISAAGDVTHGGDRRKGSDLFADALKQRDGDLSFPFRNVQALFAEDDLTIVNYEGTLTDTKSVTTNTYSFAGRAHYAQALVLGGIEAVALDNNHVFDHGEIGYADTQRALKDAGIVYSGNGEAGIFTVKGVQIGMLSYRTFDGRYKAIYDTMPTEIANLRARGCALVIVSYHWGEEREYKPNERQVALGRATVDAGADLVLGHHSHVMNAIEQYKGKYICYSLANFSFAGNSNPRDKETFIFQQRFRIADGQAEDAGMRIIPCSVSSTSAYNDFIPTPYGSDGARRIAEKLVSLGEGLAYALTRYPLGWQ